MLLSVTSQEDCFVLILNTV